MNDKLKENNYRLAKDTCTCLWCKFSELPPNKITCTKLGNVEVAKTHICNLWRYGF